MSQPSPLVIAAIAAGGFLLWSRARAQQRAITGVSARTSADYFTPTDVAGSLARFVVGLTKNISTPAPSGIFAVKPTYTPGSAESGLAGWQTYTGSVAQGSVTDSGDPYNAWAGPSTSSVNAPSATRYGTDVDQVVAAPLYDPSWDFVNNPFALAAP